MAHSRKMSMRATKESLNIAQTATAVCNTPVFESRRFGEVVYQDGKEPKVAIFCATKKCIYINLGRGSKISWSEVTGAVFASAVKGGDKHPLNPHDLSPKTFIVYREGHLVGWILGKESEGKRFFSRRVS